MRGRDDLVFILFLFRRCLALELLVLALRLFGLILLALQLSLHLHPLLIRDPLSTTQNLELENAQLREEVKNLKELTDGIMEESNTQHILGCNAYEKFIQAMTELNYDEKWITELKQEVRGLKEENEKLKAKIAKFKKILTDE